MKQDDMIPKKPIHARKSKGRALCGFESNTRIRDFSKIKEVNCKQCLDFILKCGIDIS